MNNRRSETTSKSPNEIIYGFSLREGFELSDLNLGIINNGEIHQLLRRDFYDIHHLARQEARDAIAWSHHRMQ